jgi:hypothetical protein
MTKRFQSKAKCERQRAIAGPIPPSLSGQVLLNRLMPLDLDNSSERF